jgi:hypothetical protein
MNLGSSDSKFVRSIIILLLFVRFMNDQQIKEFTEKFNNSERIAAITTFLINK